MTVETIEKMGLGNMDAQLEERRTPEPRLFALPGVEVEARTASREAIQDTEQTRMTRGYVDKFCKCLGGEQ